MEAFALRGDLIWIGEDGALRLEADSFAVCEENGLCAGVFKTLPVRYAALPVRDLRLTRRIMICFKRDKHLSPACRELKSFLIERMGLSMEEDERRPAAPRRVRTAKAETQGGAPC